MDGAPLAPLFGAQLRVKSKSIGPAQNELISAGGTTSLIFTTILIWTSQPALLIREDSGEQDVRRSVRKKASIV
jgi:hypothetical protein